MAPDPDGDGAEAGPGAHLGNSGTSRPAGLLTEDFVLS
jgi:hypothetical protein